MTALQKREDEISHEIIGAAIEVHRTLGGPGLLESVYEEALVWELQEEGLKVERQKRLPISYKGICLADPLCLDVLVEESVIIECKATIHYHSIFEAQALTYLRITGLKLALVINFGEKVVKNGIHRVVNNLYGDM
jgi:GxxExxY protein